MRRRLDVSLHVGRFGAVLAKCAIDNGLRYCHKTNGMVGPVLLRPLARDRASWWVVRVMVWGDNAPLFVTPSGESALIDTANSTPGAAKPDAKPSWQSTIPFFV